MIAFLGGLNTMGFALAGLYFLRFWRQTRDSLFIWFAAAFWLFAVNHARDAFLSFNPDSVIAYVPRLIGFALIIIAILSKNVSPFRNIQT